MAKIELVAQLPGATLDGTIPYYHSYIRVTYDNGSLFFLRGGSSDGTGQGTMFGVYGEYFPGTPDYDVEIDDIASRILIEGDDATIAGLYQTMVERADEINAARYPYDAFVNGSNALAGQLLIAIGIVDPLDHARPDPTAVPRLDADGPTLFLTAFFNPVPLSPGFHYFDVMLDEYRDWVQYNGIPFEIEQMLGFSEAWLATAADFPAVVFQAREDLAAWLFRDYGLSVVVGNNSDNTVAGTAGAEILTGLKGNDALIGLAGDDRLYGGGGNDALNGGIGADLMVGGTGDDTYLVDNAGDRVTEHAGEGIDLVSSFVSFALATDQEIENLALIGGAAINGTGNALNNTMTGNSANNTLDGGAGTDALAGGAGNDIYIVDNAADVVSENTGGGTDAVQSSVSYTVAAEVENLTLTGTAAINGTGNALNNTLNGNATNNTLDGAAGVDVLAGGAGNDTYIVDNTRDKVAELSGEGTDTVQSSVTYALPSDVENLRLTGTAALNGTGNTRINKIVGNSGDNFLYGRGGADFLIGGNGSDHLIGGLGNDDLTGGGGNDIFVFDTPPDRTSNIDRIFDFNSVNDKIALSSKYFGSSGAPGTLAADAFFIGSAAHDGSDRIMYDSVIGTLRYDSDGTGSAPATPIAMLSPGLNLSNANVLII